MNRRSFTRTLLSLPFVSLVKPAIAASLPLLPKSTESVTVQHKTNRDDYQSELRLEHVRVTAQEIKFFFFDGKYTVKVAGDPPPHTVMYYSAHLIITDGVVTKDKATGSEYEDLIFTAVRAEARKGTI